MDEQAVQKRYSQSCENNKLPILGYLKQHLSDKHKVLEIGSGTGQHVAFFANHLAHLIWQPTDVVENHASILAWVNETECRNVLAPRCFFIGQDEWHFDNIDVVYSANTAHIMQQEEVWSMMQIIAAKLPHNGVFCQYGPFKIDGEFTSPSNRDFDLRLREGGYGGIRDIAELTAWADGMQLLNNYFMPANNQLLIWKKI
jgi:SAM-dependent methyltransferase